MITTQMQDADLDIGSLVVPRWFDALSEFEIQPLIYEDIDPVVSYDRVRG